MNSGLPLDKKALREHWKASYPKDPEIRDKSKKAVLTHLLASVSASPPRRLGLYSALPWEIEIRLLFEKFPKLCVFPKTYPREKKICFFEIQSLKDLRPGLGGILEPLEAGRGVEDWGSDDLILVPGFAFDGSGARVGSGIGYYDRFFQTFPQCRKWGIAYREQIVPGKIPTESHDVRVDALCTEDGIQAVSKW